MSRIERKKVKRKMAKKRAFEIMQECQEAFTNQELTQEEISEIVETEYELVKKE